MTQLLNQVRVDAEAVIIVRTDRTQPISEVITQHSANADLTLLGIQLPSADQSAEYGERLDSLVEAVGTVLMVRHAYEGDDLLSIS